MNSCSSIGEPDPPKNYDSAMEVILNFFVTSFIVATLLIVPASLKWEFNLSIVLPYAAIVAVFAALFILLIDHQVYKLNLLTILNIEVFLIASISIATLLWRFYRDPERSSYFSNNTICSPADGKIIYVKYVNNSANPEAVKNSKKYSLKELTHIDSLSEGVFHIGIMMSFLDVHVNRAPISGKVEFLKHIKGTFKSLKKYDSIFENERAVMIIKGHNIKIGIVQIASRLVRMIVPYVNVGDVVNCGDKIGKIRFGSQVDILIPNKNGLNIKVEKNDYVKAGLTPIATIKNEVEVTDEV